MKYAVVLFLFLLSIGEASAQSESKIDSEIPASYPVDSTSISGPLVELEVTIHAISLLKISSSDSTVTPDDKIFTKGSIVNVRSANHATATYYQLNQAPEQRYDQPFRLVGKGRNTLCVRAVDAHGRESLLKLSFRIID